MFKTSDHNFFLLRVTFYLLLLEYNHNIWMEGSDRHLQMGRFRNLRNDQCEFKTLEQIADALRRLYRRCLKPINENLKISTCNGWTQKHLDIDWLCPNSSWTLTQIGCSQSWRFLHNLEKFNSTGIQPCEPYSLRTTTESSLPQEPKTKERWVQFQ